MIFTNDNKRRIKLVLPTHTLLSSLRIKGGFYYLRKLTDNDIWSYFMVPRVNICGIYLPCNCAPYF